MNPLTLVKRIQSINAKEADLGISDEASWHAKYKDSAYVFVGGLPYDLTEGDLLAVFAQYGEIVDVNLVRDKATGKSKGFAFVAYEDQRSTVLAVDNLNGAQIAGRTIRVDHVSKYKKKEEEDEETERQKREERGVCRAFQKGECKYGDSCRFSHDEQRAADTGWGPEEDRKAKWAHDKFNNRSGPNRRMDDPPPSRASKEIRADDFNNRSGPNKRLDDPPPSRASKENRADDFNNRSGPYKRMDNPPPSRASKENRADDFDRKRSRGMDNIETDRKQIEADLVDGRERGRRPEYEEGRDKQTVERRSSRYEPKPKSRDDYDGREERRSRNEKDSSVKDNLAEKDRGGDRGRDYDGREAKRSRNGKESTVKDNLAEKDRGRDRGRDYDGREANRSRNEKESSVKDNLAERDKGRDREREKEKRSSSTIRDSSPRLKNRKDDDHRGEIKDYDQRKERRVDDHPRDRRDDDHRRSHR